MKSVSWLLFPHPCSSVHGILNGVHELGSIHDHICIRRIKANRTFLALILFPLIIFILSVKTPCTITIIARGTPHVFLAVTFNGGYGKVFKYLKLQASLLIITEAHLVVSGISYHYNHFPSASRSIECDPSYQPYDKLHLKWQTIVHQIHYHHHYSGS